MSERTWTVAEIGRRIEQVVADRMAASFWVRGEVADLGRSARGMVFFSLVQTEGEGRVLARLPGTISPGKARLVDRRMARAGQPLVDGLEVRIRAHLEFFTPGGRLSLSLDDIDPAHTAGAMAVARRELLAALADGGLVDANAGRELPRLPLRLGLITRGGSRAYHDLADELAVSGLPFEVLLISSGVQGGAAAAELTAAVRAMASEAVDLLLLTRGGGADTDLMTFDDAELARAVATCPVQVWTGIGHHLDTPVVEQVAARAYKTPTALAQGVVGAVLDAIAATEQSWAQVRRRTEDHLARAAGRLDVARRRTQSARTVLRGAEGRLDADARRLDSAARRQLGGQRNVLDVRARRVHELASAAVSRAGRQLDATAGLVDAYDPARLLDRGWSVTTTAEGALVTGPVAAGTRLRTTTRGGMITSEVVHDG